MNWHLKISVLIISILSCNYSHTEKSELKTPSQIIFERVLIDSSGVENPWTKICADVDGNSFPDIIIGGQKGPLTWYRNPDWQRFEIAAEGYNTVDGEAGDIDGDGDSDIVMGGLIWYENPGGLMKEPDQLWKAHPVADHPTHDVELADINGDGRLDIVTRNQSDFGTRKGNTIHIWMNLPSGGWDEEILECEHGEGLRVSDLDSDGDRDIIGSGFWFENIKSGTWLRHDIVKWHASANVAVGDFNNDQRIDIVLTPSELAGQTYRISWFEQPKDFRVEKWPEHILVDSIECVIHGVEVGDFNQDDALDITYSEMHQGQDPDEVVVLINQEDGKSWHRILLAQNGSHSIQVDDINKDNYPDIMGANWSGDDQTVNLWLVKPKS